MIKTKIFNVKNHKYIIQYKTGTDQTRTFKTSGVGSGAMEELESRVDRSHPPRVPRQDQEITEISIVNSVN